MKKFIKNCVLFFLLLLIVGEFVVRFTHAVSDIPRRTIDNTGIQKYFINQTGYWKGGDHKWKINELGWPGNLPSSFDKLITIIGDSYIENFMNPNECHQGPLLKKRMSEYNFMEAGRSGVSFIEAMEISKHLDTLQPEQTLIYVNDNDFYESITEIKKKGDITQLNLEKSKLIYGKMKVPGLKKILYNWKLLYYFYNRNPFVINADKEKKEITFGQIEKENNDFIEFKAEIKEMFKWTVKNYETSNKILVFHPKTNMALIKLSKDYGFKSIILDSSRDNKSWTFDYDSHWTCYGHEQVANQVARSLNNYLKGKSQ